MVEYISLGVNGLDAVMGRGIPRGSLIVLSGCPGTGKTMFSAQFLYRGCVDYGEKGVYVSFAENEETFYGNMKAFGYDFEKLGKEGLFRFLDMLTVKEEGVSVILELILKTVSELGAKRLVLDSYTALAQAFRDPHEARVILHSVIGRICRRLGCTTLVISERISGGEDGAFGAEAFVADGIFLLGKEFPEQRLLRILDIYKMRGIPIHEPRLLFTLKGGFKVIPPFRAEHVKEPKRFHPQRDTADYFSTGSSDLDQVLGGGYLKGSAVLMEVEEHISTLQYHLAIVPTCWNFIVHGRGVIIIPSAGVDHNLIRKRAEEGGLTGEEVNRLLRVCVKGYRGLSTEPYIVPFKGENILEDYEEYLRMEDMLMKQTGQPPLRITGADMLIDNYGLKGLLHILRADITRLKETGGLGIIILKPGHPKLAKILGAMADVHLRIAREHGVPLLYGVKPRTGYYAIEMDTSKGYMMPKLTPIL